MDENIKAALRIARLHRAFGGDAYAANNIASGMADGGSVNRNNYQMGGVPMPSASNPMGVMQGQTMNNQPGNPMNSFGQQTQNGINGDPIRDMGYTAPPPFATLDNNLPPPQPVQAPVPSSYNPLMSNTPPMPMADGGEVKDALRLAKRTNDRLPMRPYGPRYNPETNELNSKDLKDIGYYGPIRDREGGVATEYSGNKGNFSYPTIHKGMSDADLAATMMHETLNKPKYEGEDIISERLNKAQTKIPFPEDVDQRAYEAAQSRVAEGHSPYYEPSKDEYPAWSPEQHWDEPAIMPRADGGVADALEQTHGNHAIPLHEAIARHGYATDGSVEEKQEDNTSVDNTSVAQQEDESREKFLHKELEGSAPQYNPSYDKAIKAAYQYTPPGAAMDAAGMLGNPSIKENLQSGRYVPAAMQAAAVAMPLGFAGRKAATAGLKAGAQQLYKLGKPDVVGMPGYTAYKTVEDWAPQVMGHQTWNAAKNYGAQAAEAARQALGFARGGSTPQTPRDQKSQTPVSSSGFQTTPNKEHQISPEEYKKGNTQKYEYVMAHGGSIHPDVKNALSLIDRENMAGGGVRKVNPNMDYSNSMRTYYDLVNAGHSPETAAGMVGNFMVESPSKQGNQLSFGETERGVKPGTGGAGLAQWTGPRRQEFQNFAKSQGMDWRTPQANTAFFSHEAKTNPWIGKQLEKVEAQPTAGAAAETAAKQYFRPRADALRNTLGARVGYAQNVADIAGRGNPFGGQALAQQSERANMLAQKEQEAKLMQANLPKAEDQAAPAKATPAASAALTTSSVDNSASNQPAMNFAPPQQQAAPVAAPNEESTQNFLKSQMNAPEPQEQAQPQPAQAEAPKMEVPEPAAAQVEAPEPMMPEPPENNMDMADNSAPEMPNFDMAADGGAIKPKYHSDESETAKELLNHALKLASGGGAWTRKEGKNPNGGLNAKGRASLKAQGHDIKPPAPHPKTEKDAGRRKSFCARMSGMPGPMKDDNGKPTRKALSLRAWNCHADGGEVWDKPRPKDLGKPKHLSDSQKSKAKAAAKAAGRPYPNLIDNMRAAKKNK